MIKNDFAIVGPGNHGIILSFVSSDSTGGVKPVNTETYTGKPWYGFGSKNLLPQELLEMVWASDMMPAVLSKRAAFMVGKGVRPFIEVIADGKPSKEYPQDNIFRDFSKKHNLPSLLNEVAKNLAHFNNAAVEVILTRDMTSISKLKVHDFNKVRAEVIGESGRIENYYLCGDWANAKWDETAPDTGNVTKVPAFDPENPKAHPKFIVHVKDGTVGNDYYGLPQYYGTRNWLQLANQIPLWHLAGMKNGYSVRWHVKIPESYFDKYDTPEEKQTAKTAIQESMGEWLAGVENVGKTFISYFRENENGQKINGWEVEPVSFDLHDEAFTKLYEQSQASVSSGGGIDPTLAGVQYPNKMGAGSGSEKRLTYQIHVLLNTQADRQAIIDLLNVFEKLEGWPQEWDYMFDDYDLTTLDKVDGGVQMKN